jgi:single-strand DNA-binding protein
MSNDLNSCNFIGRLGADPEIRYMTDGKAVANLNLAVGSQWKSQSGEKQEATEWVKLTAYGKLAEICGEYLKKGSQIYASGSMKTRKWQDKEGKDRYTTEVIMSNMQMLGGKPATTDAQPAQTEPAKQSANKPAASSSFDDFDDIPF